MKIRLLVFSMASLAVAAPLARPANFQSDKLLAVGPGSTSSYAVSAKPRNNFEADALLAVGPPDTSSYAAQRREVEPGNIS